MANNSKKPETRPRSNVSAVALERRAARRKNRGADTISTDWQSVDPNLLQSLIATVAKIGTITFGYTKDGGAYYINYWVDGESIKEYIRPTEDVDKVLEAELESWQ